ncbi:MAG: GGDEF domain-containing protein [Rhodoferax sp.]|nr:GGDEF domain-containing protein [Rhodoferax sp.]
MQTLEYVVWSVMLGGLLTIGTMAVVDVVMSRTLAAWRALAFIAVTGTSCVLLSGLPEDLFPGLPVVPLLVLKASLGPLSGAMVLIYLGQWLGVVAEDRLVHLTIVWGSTALVLTAVVISILAALFAQTLGLEILQLAAVVNAAGVLLASLTSLRAAQLGDKLARTMVMACLFLAISMAGLFAHQINPDYYTPPVWIATAWSTVVFFLVMVSLGIRRNRQVRRLERLAGLSQGLDPATGLPRGSVLLSKVDDAFWRSARLRANCTVICLHLRNLYALGDEAGHMVDQQILSAMAARMRRAVGFRCVVGLYHPRCFVVVLSAVTQPVVADKMGERLRELMSQPLDVTGQNQFTYAFTPQFSVGTVTVAAASAIPAQVIDEAEQLALANGREQQFWKDTDSSPLGAR